MQYKATRCQLHGNSSNVVSKVTPTGTSNCKQHVAGNTTKTNASDTHAGVWVPTTHTLIGKMEFAKMSRISGANS